MSKNAIARLGCIVVVLLLLATVATSVVESTPSDDSSSNGDEVKPNPEHLPAMCYSNEVLETFSFESVESPLQMTICSGRTLCMVINSECIPDRAD